MTRAQEVSNETLAPMRAAAEVKNYSDKFFGTVCILLQLSEEDSLTIRMAYFLLNS